MLYTVETDKTPEQATRDLQAAVERHGFGVMQVHDLQQTLEKKGVDFTHACRILEVCNPHQAKRVLDEHMALNTALPCRISVYEEGGRTRIGMIRPTALIGLFAGSDALRAVAEEVERATVAMIDEAR